MANPRRNGNGQNPNQSNGSAWWWGAAAATGALIGGAAYYYSSRDQESDEQTRTRGQLAPVVRRPISPQASSSNGLLSNFLNYIQEKTMADKFGISKSEVESRPVITNQNALLEDIYVRYVALKIEDFQLYYNVFMEVFDVLQRNMKAVDPFYKKYSSRKQIAGSHFDNLRIKKPDEFDMDIVIDLPLNFKSDPDNLYNSDIYIETKAPGFVQLKMGTQFKNIYKRDGDEVLINKTALEWIDDRGYLLNTKFKSWFTSVVVKGLNLLPKEGHKWKICINGYEYTIRLSQSGPALTFYIERPGFKLDVDFVPALKFPEERWPVSRRYRKVPPGCQREDWMVVPKPDKGASIFQDRDRSWRIAMHDQEKRLMHDNYNMKKVIRLMKKLRDTQRMNHIASYYVKTIFFWEIEERGYYSMFWRKSVAELFKIMVGKLRDAVAVRKIPYYWNSECNLIEGAPSDQLRCYERKMDEILNVLDNQPKEFVKISSFLLTDQELQEYRHLIN